MSTKSKIAASTLCLLLFMPALGWGGSPASDPDGTPSVGSDGEAGAPPTEAQVPTAAPEGLSAPNPGDHPAPLDLAGWLQSLWDALRFALPGGA